MSHFFDLSLLPSLMACYCATMCTFLRSGHTIQRSPLRSLWPFTANPATRCNVTAVRLQLKRKCRSVKSDTNSNLFKTNLTQWSDLNRNLCVHSICLCLRLGNLHPRCGVLRQGIGFRRQPSLEFVLGWCGEGPSVESENGTSRMGLIMLCPDMAQYLYG